MASKLSFLIGWLSCVQVLACPLFVLYDQGEKDFLKPLMQYLKAENKPFKVVHLIGDREDSQDDIVVDRSVSCIITGVASIGQGQYLDAYKDKATTIAVWDNLNTEGKSIYFKVAHAVAPKADWIWCPSTHVKKALGNTPKHLLVGHPGIEAWVKAMREMDLANIYQKHHLDPRQKYIVYLSEWNHEPEFQKAFALFAKCWSSSDREEILLISPHPKSADALIEKAILEQTGCHQFKIIPNQSMELLAISSKAICHKTTTSIKAAIAGIPTMHVMLDRNWISPLPIATSISEFSTALKNLKSLEHPYDAYGIPHSD